jgi:hypothetical protein
MPQTFDQPEEQRFTTWRNPTDHEMRVDVYESHGRRKRFVFPPKREVNVPSEYDHAIHDERDGIIVGGLAPLLQRAVGQGVLHSALDPEEAARKAALEESERAVLAKKAADEVLAQVTKPADKPKR